MTIQVERWSWYIDFWMKDEIKKNLAVDGKPEQDWNCLYEGSHDCTPKAVIQFEHLMSANPLTGQAEMNKIGSILDSSPNINVIEPEAITCVYNEVMTKKAQRSANGYGHGLSSPQLKTSTFAQLQSMKNQIKSLRDKYTEYQWNENHVAVDLVGALDYYISEVEAELNTISLAKGAKDVLGRQKETGWMNERFE